MHLSGDRLNLLLDAYVKLVEEAEIRRLLAGIDHRFGEVTRSLSAAGPVIRRNSVRRAEVSRRFADQAELVFRVGGEFVDGPPRRELRSA